MELAQHTGDSSAIIRKKRFDELLAADLVLEPKPFSRRFEERLREDLILDDGPSPLYQIVSTTPWWMISVALHALIIIFLSLRSMAIDLPDAPLFLTTTELMPRAVALSKPPDSEQNTVSPLQSKHNTPAADPDSKTASDIVVPPDLLAAAQLGDHFETVNLDLPDTQSAFGNPDAHMFHNNPKVEPAGGGGTGGAALEDLIGVGGLGNFGSGGGWGGGHGTGIGVDTGSGRGSFGQRNGGGRKLMVQKHGGSPATEKAVDDALRWLANHQEPDGHWDCSRFEGSAFDTAATGWALLAFLGAGHTEKFGAYKDNVKRAVSWFRANQDSNGAYGRSGGLNGYEIAIATMAMAEAAGMANIHETRVSAQRGVDYCTNIHQHGEGSNKLGWRYNPKMPGDTSVTGWFVMALKSAKVAGLRVDESSFDGAIRFLNAVEIKNITIGQSAGYYAVSSYGYLDKNEQPTARLGAIGNLCRQFLGVQKDNLASSIEWFVSRGGIPGQTQQVDLYYWYYGSLCTFQQGGSIWTKWNDGMKKSLTTTQRKDGDFSGSWDPRGDFAPMWGRAGQTALSALCLEVYYRYMLMQQ